MKKLYVLIILLGALAGVYLALKFSLRPEVGAMVVPKTSPSEAPKSQQVTEIPHRIKIPTLAVDALVESVGVDNLGNMDVPKDFGNTAWYNQGPKPGENGSAVIDGHVDTPNGDPAVFAKISQLKVGDKIEVTDKTGNTFVFSVTNVKDYTLDEIPLQQIFSKNTSPMLNLITCAGTFDEVKKTYDKRTVVYSVLEKE